MAWQRTKPVAASNVESSPVRGNFQAVDQSLWGRNLVPDSMHQIWPGKNELAYWTKTNFTMTRELTTIKEAAQSIKLVYSGAGTDILQHMLISVGGLIAPFQSKPFSWGLWVKSNTATAGFSMDDGVTSTNTLHTGGNTWEWITGTKTLSASATYLALKILQSGAGTTYVGPITVVAGSIPPQSHIPSHVKYALLGYQLSGNPVSTGKKLTIVHGRPYMVKDVYVESLTANNTTTPLIVDVRQYAVGAGVVSMFLSSELPTISTSQARGSFPPSLSATTTAAGAYHKACFDGLSGSTLATGSMLWLNVNQAATSSGHNTPSVFIRCLTFDHALEAYRAYNEFK
jgi:hypothetical protein